MSNRVKRTYLDVIKFINIAAVAVLFGLGWWNYYNHLAKSRYSLTATVVFVALYAIVYATYADIYKAFEFYVSRISELVYSQFLAIFISDVIIFIVMWLLIKGTHIPNVLPHLLVMASQMLFCVGWSFVSHHWYYRKFPPKETAIIYDMREDVDKLIEEHQMEANYHVCRIMSAEECIAKGVDLSGIESVFICGVHSHDRNIIIKYCVKNNIESYIIPRVGDVIMSSAERVNLLHLPMLRVTHYEPTIGFVVIKRLIDIVLSAIALILLSPFMIITAIAIKATDGGPVFYKQCRLTKDGRKFNVLKFRSMRVDAEKDGVARLSTGDSDDRITPVGRFIRKVRIDELPQLINILKGDMSIVGPRPERPEIAADYEKTLPEFGFRLQAKAGLTGYAQVYGKYNTTPYDKLQMDLMYIAKPSLMEDLRIMFATIKILFVPESTEGIAEGSTTAMEQEKD